MRAGIRSLVVATEAAYDLIQVTDPAYERLDTLGVVMLGAVRSAHAADAFMSLIARAGARPRVLRLALPLTEDGLASILTRPVASRLEVLDLRGSYSATNRALNIAAFDGVVMR
jgi:hypothetical protein